MHIPLGPYEKAEYESVNSRDNNLWIACLAHSGQDVAVAKSKYIKQVAQIHIEQETKHAQNREARERDDLKAREIEALESAKLEEQFARDFQAVVDAEVLTRSELPFLMPKNGALTFALLGSVSSLIAIGAGSIVKYAFIAFLTIAYAHTGYVVWHKIRGFFVPAYKARYGNIYPLGFPFFATSLAIVIIMTIAIAL